MRHTLNSSRMEDALNELGAIIEDQIVVATLFWPLECHCFAMNERIDCATC